MASELSLREQEQITEAIKRHGDALTRAERRAEFVVSGGFVAAAAALVLLFTPVAHAWHPPAAICCFVALVVALRAEFDIGSGFTVPSQLAFVPLLFTVPPSVAPIVVVLALVVAFAPDVARGQLRAVRMVRFLGSAWFAVGPALVLALAGVDGPADAAPLVLLTALAGQFTCDLAGSTVRDFIAYRSSLREQLEEAWVYGVDIALTPVGLVLAWHITDMPWAALAVVPLLVVFGNFGRERRRRVESLVELNRAYRGTALLLGDVVEADDQYTGEHSRGVVELARDVGQRLGLGDERLRNLEFGALLHDVGKVAIPKEIINKPGKLDAREWEIIKTHTVEGQRMLDRVGGFMSDVGRIVRSHHERWDGNGYPDRLAGEQIPIEARIISVCDTWSAMTTNRPYRAALPAETATQELIDCAGSQLDPDVVAAALAVVAPPTAPDALPRPEGDVLTPATFAAFAPGADG
jgi:putative nucleotidyltransferase with HDIG domain